MWTAHSSAHPELAPGLTGAYVRVHTAGDSSSGVDSLPEAIGGRFHVLQVNIHAHLIHTRLSTLTLWVTRRCRGAMP